MRIMIKGGVWKNTEDEILKVAVMKYGLNQWSRISSLLVRKSAKQCKARWYEWLDPSIRKTEWTREEDEKLLHLAKLMPCQWRTIAPIVGRTPTQCLDRYEKLLDMAVSKEDRYDPSDDPRRLRPGEIDPNPESKPARPDAIDMEEDEKEMLSEARARLANTRGKKAKRKAREKQLEEARRLASLQKKRELKAAGIEQRGKFKKRGGVDYSSEVAFEKKPASGFFDTTQEDGRSKELQLEFRPITVEELEGKRRKDVEEALVKKDIKKAKLNEGQNPLAAIAAQAADNDPAMLRRRTKMMLPAPQVSEAELEAIARMSTEAEMMPEVADGAGGDATRQLLGQYGPMPSRAPARTPRTASTGDRLMMDAQNLVRMTNMATPLLGGANPELHPSDFSGATPRSAVPSTPNPLAGTATPRNGNNSSAITSTPSVGVTPAHGRASFALAGVSATPSMLGGTPLRGGAPGGGGSSMMHATPMRTPLRDELGLNDTSSSYGGGEGGSRRAEAARANALRMELRGALGALPAPANEYVFAAPALPEDEGEGDGGMEEDAADGKARRAREAEEARMVLERKKSTVLQRGLPRPTSLDTLRPPKPAHELAVLSLRERAEEALHEEYCRLLTHDALAYPVQTRDRSDKKSNKRSAPSVSLGPALPLEDIPPEALQAAAALIREEVAFLVRSMGHDGVAHEEYADVASTVAKDMLFLPSKGRYERLASATPTERTEALKAEFDAVHAEMDREARKGVKMEGKVGTLLGGLMGRGAKMQEGTRALWAEGLQLEQELTCFKDLKQRELRNAPNRIENLRSLVAAAGERERTLQECFKSLTQQRDELMQACTSDLLHLLQQPRALPA